MTIVGAVLGVLALAMVLTMVRVVAGPTLADRVVALDLFGNLTVGVIAVCAVTFNESALLQPALIIALLAFIGTVAFARYLERMQR